MKLKPIIYRYWYFFLIAIILAQALIIFLWPARPLLPDILDNGLIYSNKFDNVQGSNHVSVDRGGGQVSALLLNGTNDYVLSEENLINITTDFTFGFWLKPLANHQEQVILMKGEICPDGSPHFVGMSFVVEIQANNKLGVRIIAGGGTHMDEHLAMESEKSVPKFQWTFISITYDNSAKSFGLTFNQQPQRVKQSSGTNPENFTEIHQSDSPLKIGVGESYCDYKHQFSDYYYGYLDDLYIFDRGLSLREISLLSGNPLQESFWQRKSVPITISVILLVLATTLAWLLKTNYSIIQSAKKNVSMRIEKYDFEDVIIFFTICFGVFLACKQFVYNRDMWTDEVLLGVNIVNRNPLELLRPLDHFQVAPILFLQIEKLFSQLTSDTDMGLRIFPLTAFLVSIYLIYKVLIKIHANKYAVIVGLALFGFNSTLIYYSSEVKQYMIDVLAVSLIYFLLLKDYTNVQRKFIYLGVFGTVCIFLTNVAPIILFTAGTFLVFHHDLMNARIRTNLMAVFAAWTVAFGIYFYSFIWHHPAAEAMLNYWSSLDVFIPKNPLSKPFHTFLLNKWFMVRRNLFQFGDQGFILLNILAVAGILSLLLRRKIGYLILTCLPVILHIFLSAFRIYPLDVRLILYMCPVFIILFSFGVKELIDILFADLKIARIRYLSFAIPIWFATLFFAGGFYGASFPFHYKMFKNNFIYLNENWQTGDGLYVSPATVIYFNYYRSTSLFNIKIDTVALGQGRATAEEYAREISSFHGRQWVVFGGDEGEIVPKLKELGYSVEDEFRDGGVSSFLFDFK